MIADYFLLRPYFFHEHPNICGRVPELADYKGGAKVWDYYSTMNLTPNILYLAEASQYAISRLIEEDLKSSQSFNRYCLFP